MSKYRIVYDNDPMGHSLLVEKKTILGWKYISGFDDLTKAREYVDSIAGRRIPEPFHHGEVVYET